MDSYEKHQNCFNSLIGFCSVANAMDYNHQQPLSISNSTIPDENIIRLVFMGPTGAGKSTTISAFYNFANHTQWDDYPKLFPIPTAFQGCNVKEYEARHAEDHTQGQLGMGTVTQEPSEYLATAKNYVLSLIDCPGMADPRGIEKDDENTMKIAEFLSETGSFNAICIVWPITINRKTIEVTYFIEAIKSIIPSSAYDRIFICVTSATSISKNFRNFVESFGLPSKNIFIFDNFGLTYEGYFQDLSEPSTNYDDNMVESFDTANTHTDNGDQDHLDDVKRVKDTWIKSHREFNKLLRKANDLGRYELDE